VSPSATDYTLLPWQKLMFMAHALKFSSGKYELFVVESCEVVVELLNKIASPMVVSSFTSCKGIVQA